MFGVLLPRVTSVVTFPFGIFFSVTPVLLGGGLFLSKEFKAIHKEIPLNLLGLRSFVKASISGQALACTFRPVGRYATLNRACPCVWHKVGMVGVSTENGENRAVRNFVEF